jgi:outer membrane protein TolC
MRRVLTVLVGLIMLLSLGLSLAWAKEPARPELSLSEAVKRALNASSEVKAAKLNIDKAYEQREDAADLVEFAPTGGNVNPQTEATFYDLVQSDLNWRIQKKDYEAKQDSVVFDVYQKYIDILKALEKVQTAEVALSRDEENLRVTKSSQRVGLVTASAVIGAEAKAAASKENLAAAQEELTKAYVSFNKLVDLCPEDRPVLTDKIFYSPLQIDNLDTEVARAVEASRDLWKLKQNISIQKLDLNFFSKPYDIEKYDVDIAELTSFEAEKKIKELVRTLYHDICTLEEQYAAAIQGLQAAEEALRIAKVQYDVGMITKAKLKEAEAAVFEAKNAVSTITYQHAVLKASFYQLTDRPLVSQAILIYRPPQRIRLLTGK